MIVRVGTNFRQKQARRLSRLADRRETGKTVTSSRFADRHESSSTSTPLPGSSSINTPNTPHASAYANKLHAEDCITINHNGHRNSRSLLPSIYPPEVIEYNRSEHRMNGDILLGQVCIVYC